jgi:hypothetical protein
MTAARRDALLQRRRILLRMLTAARFQYAGSPPELIRLLRGWTTPHTFPKPTVSFDLTNFRRPNRTDIRQAKL